MDLRGPIQGEGLVSLCKIVADPCRAVGVNGKGDPGRGELAAGHMEQVVMASERCGPRAQPLAESPLCPLPNRS